MADFDLDDIIRPPRDGLGTSEDDTFTFSFPSRGTASVFRSDLSFDAGDGVDTLIADGIIDLTFSSILNVEQTIIEGGDFSRGEVTVSGARIDQLGQIRFGSEVFFQPVGGFDNSILRIADYDGRGIRPDIVADTAQTIQIELVPTGRLRSSLSDTGPLTFDYVALIYEGTLSLDLTDVTGPEGTDVIFTLPEDPRDGSPGTKLAPAEVFAPGPTALSLTIMGSALPDDLQGGDGTNTLDGAGGNDILRGGEGNDTLRGGIGDDRLIGGYGQNVYEGGAGNDRIELELEPRPFRAVAPDASNTVIFGPGDGVDTISNPFLLSFIDLGRFDEATAQAAYDTRIVDSTGMTLDFGSGDRLIIEGGTDASVPRSKFLGPGFNTPATDVTLENVALPELPEGSVTVRTKVADIVATDVDATTFTLSGAAAEFFEIVGDELFLVGGIIIPLADTGGFSVRIVGDGGPSAELTLEFAGPNLPAEEAAVSLSRSTLLDDESEGGPVAIISFIDIDGDTEVTLSGDDADFFEIEGDELFLKDGVELDAPTQASLEVTVSIDGEDVAVSVPVVDADGGSVVPFGGTPVFTFEEYIDLKDPPRPAVIIRPDGDLTGVDITRGGSYRNVDTLSLSGANAVAIYGQGSNTIENAGSISVNGTESTALAFLISGVLRNTGNITVSGTEAVGLYFEGTGSATNAASGVINVSGEEASGIFIEGSGTALNEGTINVTGTAIGASGIGGEGEVDLANTGRINVSSTFGGGMVFAGEDRTLLNEGTIALSGPMNIGIGAAGTNNVAIHRGTITGSGDETTGVALSGFSGLSVAVGSGLEALIAGEISLTGPNSIGVLLASNSGKLQTTAPISVTGDFGTGIAAVGTVIDVDLDEELTVGKGTAFLFGAEDFPIFDDLDGVLANEVSLSIGANVTATTPFDSVLFDARGTGFGIVNEGKSVTGFGDGFKVGGAAPGMFILDNRDGGTIDVSGEMFDVSADQVVLTNLVGGALAAGDLGSFSDVAKLDLTNEGAITARGDGLRIVGEESAEYTISNTGAVEVTDDVALRFQTLAGSSTHQFGNGGTITSTDGAGVGFVIGDDGSVTFVNEADIEAKFDAALIAAGDGSFVTATNSGRLISTDGAGFSAVAPNVVFTNTGTLEGLGFGRTVDDRPTVPGGERPGAALDIVGDDARIENSGAITSRVVSPIDGDAPIPAGIAIRHDGNGFALNNASTGVITGFVEIANPEDKHAQIDNAGQILGQIGANTEGSADEGPRGDPNSVLFVRNAAGAAIKNADGTALRTTSTRLDVENRGDIEGSAAQAVLSEAPGARFINREGGTLTNAAGGGVRITDLFGRSKATDQYTLINEGTVEVNGSALTATLANPFSTGGEEPGPAALLGNSGSILLTGEGGFGLSLGGIDVLGTALSAPTADTDIFGAPAAPDTTAQVINTGTITMTADGNVGLFTGLTVSAYMANEGTITGGGRGQIGMGLQASSGVKTSNAVFNLKTIELTGAESVGMKIDGNGDTVRVGQGELVFARGGSTFSVSDVTLDIQTTDSDTPIFPAGKIEVSGPNAIGLQINGNDVTAGLASGVAADDLTSPRGAITATGPGGIAVQLNADGGVFINNGEVRGDRAAIQGSAGDQTVINLATIEGLVDLGGGQDIYQTLYGAEGTGIVNGGDGVDTLRLFSTSPFDDRINPDTVPSFDLSRFTNFEVLEVFGGGTTAVTGTFAGPTLNVIEGSQLFLDDATVPALKARDGFVTGTGTLGDVEIDEPAVFAPGTSPGTVRITGDLIVRGTLDLEVGGAEEEDQDLLIIDGTADLSGATVKISFIDGFVPEAGSGFSLIEATGGITGLETAAVEVTDAPPGFTVSINPDGSVDVEDEDPTNIPPTASPIDAGTTGEDASPVSIDLLTDASADDPDGGTLAINDVSVTLEDGTPVAFTLDGPVLTIDPGQFADMLGAGDSAVLSITYDITDGQGGETPNSGTLTIAGRDGPFTWFVDADGDGFGIDDPATNVTAYDAPAGTVATSGDADDTDASIFPDAPEINDGKDNDQDGSVDEDNRDPIPDPVTLTVRQDTVLTVPVATLLAGDTDPDGDALAITGVTPGANGLVTLDDLGDDDPDNDLVIFTPTAGFTGEASFSYLLTDGFGGDAVAPVSVMVTEAPPPPPDDVLDLAALPLSGFGTQDAGTATFLSDGTAVRLEANAWKQFATDITVETDTVLNFTFASDVEGEIHGIGFETDEGLSEEFIFKVHGTQDWGNDLFDDRYTTGSGPQSYSIPVGQFFTGSFDRIVVVMDDDAGVGADSTFSDISLSTTSSPLVDGAPVPLTGYDGTQDQGVAEISEDGTSILLQDNAWKQLAVDVTVESNTLLSFDFAADVEGDIHAIGFESDGMSGEEFIFKLHGTQDFGIDAFDDRYETGSGFLSYQIPVGQFFTGSFDRMVLIMDDDADVGATSTFANIAFDTEDLPLVSGEVAPISSFGGPQDQGVAIVRDGGATIELQDNAWKQLDTDIFVDEDTQLAFDFASDVEGDIHGIGFENDGLLSEEFVFKLDGDQDWGIDAFDGLYETGSGAQSYTIPVGAFFTGEFDRLVLVMDDDADLGADSIFSDIEIL
ncbi:MAG: cadherin-like domain-containing protein [Pseudomonadota bacterium]